MKIKYAAFIIDSIFPYPEISKFNFDSKTFIIKGSIKSFFQKRGNKHWQKWLGTLFWDQLQEGKYAIVTYMETSTPSVDDHENNKLQNKVYNIYNLLPLTEVLYPPHQEMILITGSGELKKKILKFKSVSTVSRFKPWRESGYLRHLRALSRNPITWQANPNLLNQWKNLFTQTNKCRKFKYRQIVETFRSYDEAFKNGQLEFKIPNLVRSIECVIALKPNDRSNVFVSRVKKLIAGSKLPFKSSKTLDQQLLDIYQLRNDCVHGKEFALSLKKQMGRSFRKAQIYKYEYLIEMCARKILADVVLSPSKWKYFKNRDTIEKAWIDGHF